MNHKIVFKKIEKAFKGSSFDALIITGADNFLYLTGTSLQNLYSQKELPFIFFWSKTADPVCICPALWESTLKQISDIKRIHTYPLSSNSLAAAVSILMELVFRETSPEAAIGVDLERTSAATMQLLNDWASSRSFVSADSWLKNLRMVKTGEEIPLLKTIAARTEHAISGSSHHLSTIGGKSEKFQSEDVRVHCIEREMDTAGYHCLSLVASGEHAKKMWPIAPRFGLGREKNIGSQEVVRIEMRAILDGYWSNNGKIIIKGDYTPTLKEKYAQLAHLRDFTVSQLKPGVTCSQVYQTVTEEAHKTKVTLLEATPIGHSIGVTPREAPYLLDGDDTVISRDMVFVVDIGTHLDSGEIFRIKDMVLVKEDGAEILGWYQNWDHPYITAYSF